MSVLFPVEYKAKTPQHKEQASDMTKLFRHYLQSEIERVIWQEMVRMEGEQALQGGSR
jgi:hypothetical protein